MSPEQQRIAIAEACGWTEIEVVEGMPFGILDSRTDESPRLVPDYLNDLNAMHEAEKYLAGYPSKEWDNYIMDLHAVTQYTPSGKLSEIACITHATAAQRAEAFLRTLGLWKE